MANDVADYTSAVVIQSGTVTISGTASVSIAGTPTVVISGTPTVNVGNTPSVSISSGTVNATILGTPNINISSQSVNLTVVQPQVQLGSFTVVGAGATNNATYAAGGGAHALGIMVLPGLVGEGLSSLTVVGVTTGATYLSVVGSAATTYLSGLFVVPILSALDASYTITATTDAGSTHTQTVYTVAILDAEGVFVFNNLHDPAAVTLTDVSGNAMGIGNNPVSVTVDATKGFLLVANKRPVGNIAVAATNAAIITGVVGQKIYIHSIECSPSTVAAASSDNFTDGSGGAIVFASNRSALGSHHMEGHASPLTLSNGLFLNVPAAGSTFYNVAFSQA